MKRLMLQTRLGLIMWHYLVHRGFQKIVVILIICLSFELSLYASKHKPTEKEMKLAYLIGKFYEKGFSFNEIASQLGSEERVIKYLLTLLPEAEYDLISAKHTENRKISAQGDDSKKNVEIKREEDPPKEESLHEPVSEIAEQNSSAEVGETDIRTIIGEELRRLGINSYRESVEFVGSKVRKKGKRTRGGELPYVTAIHLISHFQLYYQPSCGGIFRSPEETLKDYLKTE